MMIILQKNGYPTQLKLVQNNGLTKTLFPASYKSLRRIFKKVIEDLDNKI